MGEQLSWVPGVQPVSNHDKSRGIKTYCTSKWAPRLKYRSGKARKVISILLSTRTALLGVQSAAFPWMEWLRMLRDAPTPPAAAGAAAGWSWLNDQHLLGKVFTTHCVSSG